MATFNAVRRLHIFVSWLAEQEISQRLSFVAQSRQLALVNPPIESRSD
jgi:hypothetical protein